MAFADIFENCAQRSQPTCLWDAMHRLYGCARRPYHLLFGKVGHARRRAPEKGVPLEFFRASTPKMCKLQGAA